MLFDVLPVFNNLVVWKQLLREWNWPKFGPHDIVYTLSVHTVHLIFKCIVPGSKVNQGLMLFGAFWGSENLEKGWLYSKIWALVFVCNASRVILTVKYLKSVWGYSVQFWCSTVMYSCIMKMACQNGVNLRLWYTIIYTTYAAKTYVW